MAKSSIPVKTAGSRPFGPGQGQVIKGWDEGVQGMEGRRKTKAHDSTPARVRVPRGWWCDSAGCNLGF